MNNRLTLLWLKWLAGSAVPPSWIYPPVLPEAQRAKRAGKLHIEIVSHCWQYSRLLAYQLGSLVHHPVRDATVTMTVFYAMEDKSTADLLHHAAEHNVSNITWNWQPLSKSQLFRRCIGRNRAALASRADWVWFTDCDMTFQDGCIDSLNAALQERTDALIFPRVEAKTDVYSENDLITQNTIDTPELLQVPKALFTEHVVDRATGPLQITHGDVARANGYCRDVPFYQQPAAHFQKATEDRLFRWLLGTQGVPVDVKGVCRIQHAVKGRYQKGSTVTGVRQKIRKIQHSLRKHV